MEDEQIIKLYLQRNEKALEEIQNKYGSYCFRIAKNILTVWEDAEECVNDTWNLSWNKIPPIIPLSLKAFLGKLVRDIAISQYRANHAKKRYRGIEVIFDGGHQITLKAGDRVEIAQSEKTTGIIKLHKESFLEILNKKLGES